MGGEGGRGGEGGEGGRGREGRGGEGRGGEGGREGMGVITCNSAFEYNNYVTYYVITRNYQWTPEILTNNLLEAGCTNKLCPFQYNVTLSCYLLT